MMSPSPRRGAPAAALVLACASAALPAASARAQQATGAVTGRVTDAATGRALPDVQLLVAGTRLGAVTNAAGEYRIGGVPAGARSVTARRIGYQPQSQAVTVAPNGTATAAFRLAVSALNLEEVVVTGSGAPTERRRVGTSVASVDSTVIARAQAVTVDQALQGKVPGAQITQNSGGPGGGGISVRLRGTNSFISGSDPLYIVDGVIIDNGSSQLADLGGRANPQNRLADLNPADIDRVEIIRGAAAAALYGSRANNGVVQIFTKRGNIGRPRATLLSRYATNALRAEQPYNLYPFDAAGLPVQRFNYQNDIFRRAPATEQNLTVEGGNDQTRYFLSGNATVEEGIIRSTSSRRAGGRVNVQQQLRRDLQANVTANYVATRNQYQAFGEQNDYGIMGSLIFAPTSVDFRPDANGNYPLPPSLGTNPLLAIDRIRNPQEIDRFIGSAKLTYTPLERLLLDYTLGLDNTGFQQDQFIPRNAVLSTAPIATGRSQAVFQGTRVLNQDAVASYTWPALGGFTFRTTGGFNHTAQRVRVTNAVANGLAPVGELVSAGSVFSAGQTETELRTLGFYGQQEAAWNDRLFLTGAVRYDASSTFAPSERWQAFPKLSASYVALANRPGAFNNLRVRSALGWAGSQPGLLNAYSQFVSYTQLPFAGRPGFVNDVVYGNPTLRNERAREWEVGGDAGFLGGRVSAEGTYYNRLVNDLLFFRPLATSTGFSRQFFPIGSMSNKGVELLLRTTNVDRPRFTWTSTATYARNRNRVERLSIQDFQSAAAYPNRIRAGEPAGVFYGSYAARDCITGALLLDSLGRYRRSNQTVDMGDSTRRRLISRGTCNDSLNKVIGDPNPNFLASLFNEFTVLRKLRVRALLDGTFGNDVMNLSTRAQNAGIASNSKEYERELLPYGDPRKLPPGFNARTQGVFEYWVEDGSFVKLREVSATYTLDARVLRRAFRDGVELTVSGRNLAVWTNYSGYDPELNLFGTNAGGLNATQTTAADRGFDFGGYPIPRVWSASARFTF